MLTSLFLDLGSWRDTDAAVFVEQAVPVIQAAQETMAQLAAVYVATQAAEAFGLPDVPQLALDTVALTSPRRGVLPEDVYLRPFVNVRAALARGLSLDQAVQRGVTRLGQITEMDLQMAYRDGSNTALQSLPDHARPRYWARVLVGAENCGLCVIASTQRYTIGDLNPIHPACDCTVKPIATHTDPGLVIAPELLERAHAEIENRTGTSDRGARAPDYRKYQLRDITGQHSEIGALLRSPRDHFTTARELATT